MKRVLSFCAVLLLLISTFAVSVSAADSDQYGRGANVYSVLGVNGAILSYSKSIYSLADLVRIGGCSFSMAKGHFVYSPVKEVRVMGSNLIPYPFVETTKIENGLTIIDNGDGTLTLNGTASDDVIFRLTDSGWLYCCTAAMALSYGVLGSDNVGFSFRSSSGEYVKTVSTFDMDYNYNDYLSLKFDSGSSFDNVTITPAVGVRKITSLVDLQYRTISYDIPDAVLSLPCYGHGISRDLCNYLEFTPAGAVYYHQRVGVRNYEQDDEDLDNVVTDRTSITVYPLDQEIVTDVTHFFDWNGVIEAFSYGSVWFVSEAGGSGFHEIITYNADPTESCTTSHYFGIEYTCLFCGAHVPPPFHVLIMQNIIGGIGIGSNVATGFSDLFDSMMISNGKLTTIASMAFAFAGLALIIVIFYAISRKFKK